MPSYRAGVQNATSNERAWLLYIEERARQQVLQEAVYEEIRGARLGLADCNHLHIAGSKLGWFRHNGDLYVRVRVAVNPGRFLRTIRWRVPGVRKPQGPPQRLGPRPLDNRPTDRYPSGARAGERVEPTEEAVEARAGEPNRLPEAVQLSLW